MIKGVYAADIDSLDSEQWVNVYHLLVFGKAIYHSSCQVKDLVFSEDEFYEYGLELVDEDGNLMEIGL